MFDGMDMKASPGPAAPPSKTPDAGSAFGFMGGDEGKATPSGGSAFGFMGGDEESAAETGKNSGFSFMSSSNDNSAGGASGGLDFGGMKMHASDAPATGGGLDFGGMQMRTSAPPQEAKGQGPASGGGLDFGGMTMHASSDAPTNNGNSLDFGGLTVKNHEASDESASGGGALDFGGLTLKKQASNASNASEEADGDGGALDFGGLQLRAPSQQNSQVGGSGSGDAVASSHTTPPTLVTAATPPRAQTPPQPDMGPREWVEQALVQYWGQMKKVIETGQRTAFRHGGLLRSLEAEQALRQSSEEEQVTAIESEEYEKADELNEAIEKSKAATLRIEKDLAAATKELEAQRVEREQCHKRVVAALSESVAKLDSLKKERGGALNAFVTAEKRRLEEGEDEVQAEMGRVERFLQHTRSDLEDVAAAQGKIEELIKADTRDVQEEKAKLTTAKIALEIDLDALREQLRLKEAEVEGNDRALQAAEDEINKVRVGHERKLNRLGEQEAQITTEQTGAESEQEELKGRRAGLLHETEVMEGKAAAMRAGIAGVSGDAATVATFLLRMTAEETRGNTFLVSARRCEARVEELSRQKQQTAARAESLRVELADLEARIAEHHQTIVGVDLKKPSLEAQKKAEVAKRDFKAAGAVSKEIKDLSASKEEAETDIAALQAKITRSTAAAAVLTEEAQATEASLGEAQVEGDANRLQMLVDREKYLTLVLEEIASRTQGGSRNEAEREFVDTELGAVCAEADSLRDKHHWGDDFKIADESISVPQGAAVDHEAVVEVAAVASGETVETEVKESEDNTEVAVETEAETEMETEMETEVESELETKTEVAAVEEEEPSVTIEEVEAKREALQEATVRVEEAEESIEACIEAEDFDACDELEDSLQGLRSEVATLQVWLNKHEGSVSSPVLEEEGPGEHTEEAEAAVDAAEEAEEEEEPTTEAPREDEEAESTSVIDDENTAL